MVSAILLGAGMSKRMGNLNKLLLPFEESSVLLNSLNQLLASTIDEVILVLGFDYKIIKEITPKHSKLIITNNEAYETGMTSSIKTGIRRANVSSSHYLICLGDMPLISTQIYNAMLESIKGNKSTDLIFRPEFKGIPGHPVCFSASYKEELLACQALNGCQSVIKNNESKQLTINIDDESVLMDIDTIEDFEAIVKKKSP